MVLATALIETLHLHHPGARIDFLLRKGNENLLANNPHLSKIHIWNKKERKLRHLWTVAREIRREAYDVVINVHRGATSGFVTWMSGAAHKRGFSKNPFAWCFTHRSEHHFSTPDAPPPYLHETARNQQLIAGLTGPNPARPAIYPAPADFDRVRPYTINQYVCVAPSSVWAPKRFPPERWAELLRRLPDEFDVWLLGGAEDREFAETILTMSGRLKVRNLSGDLSMMQSAALMRGAAMNYTNDSGPMHFASAVNAPVTAVYCSTHPCFGFGPLSDRSRIVQVEGLYCKPCGLHGYPACPQGHFRCAQDINMNELLWWTIPTI